MKYEFVGANGSSGFLHGQIYDLELYQEHTLKSYKPYILAVTRYKKVPYDNMEMFKKNWKKIGE